MQLNISRIGIIFDIKTSVNGVGGDNNPFLFRSIVGGGGIGGGYFAQARDGRCRGGDGDGGVGGVDESGFAGGLVGVDLGHGVEGGGTGACGGVAVVSS